MLPHQRTQTRSAAAPPRAGLRRDPVAWKKAAKNTLNCLIGCSIGDFGTIIIVQTYYPATPIWLMMAFSMSFLSMLGMELVANFTDLTLTGGKVPVSGPFYWLALAISLLAGFLAPLPYNYYKLKKLGKACH